MSDIEFVDELPNAKKGSSAGTSDIVAKLRAQPGSWAIVKRAPAHNGLTSLQQSLQRRGCEASCRKLDAKTVELYARWPEVVS